MNYKKQPKGTKWFYVPERFYDAAQRLHDNMERYGLSEYTMLWSECEKSIKEEWTPGSKCRSLLIEVSPEDFPKLTSVLDASYPGDAWSMDVGNNDVTLYFYF